MRAAASHILYPVVRELVADSLTPITAALALAKPGAFVLLESVDNSHDRLSRYSFLGLDYLATETYSADDALAERLRDFITRFQVAPREGLPYTGGVVALFAYDAVRAFAPLGAPPSPAVVPDLYAVVPGTWLLFDHLTHRLTLIGLASRGEEEAVEMRLRLYEQRLLAQLPTLPKAVRATGSMECSLNRAEYLERVAAAQVLIAEGDIYQLQVGIRFTAPIDGTPFDMYRAMRMRNPSPYMFFIDTPYGTLFGASPEFLVRLEGRRATLRPLAGTRGRGVTPELDARIAAELLRDPKERAEHVMLVDLGRHDLGRVAEIGTVSVDEFLRIERYSHVMHLVSNVTAQLRHDVDAVDLFAAGFPAGTVTGTPKIRAMQRIDALEPTARGWYAGSLAHFDFNGDMDSCITLRSVHVVEQTATWQASAGIVADSEPAAEYAEVFHKTALVRSILGLPPLEEVA